MIKSYRKILGVRRRGQKGDTFLFGASTLEANPGRLPNSLPPNEHTPQLYDGCHPSHNPYDPPFDAHGGAHALSYPPSPGQHLTEHHTTTNPPVLSSERKFVQLLLRPEPKLLTVDLYWIFFIASSSGPETSERGVGVDLVCGHVRDLCSSHRCGVL
jgi:hypothetical protein